MRNKLYKIVMAALVLALAFTFSCSSDTDDDDKGKSSSTPAGNNVSSSSSQPSGGGGSSSSSSKPSSSSSQPSSGNSGDCVIKTPYHQGICPSGSHIPTKEEWEALITAAGGTTAAAKRLMSANGWNTYQGTDNYGFKALPGGYCTSSGSCVGGSTGNKARWWSASEGGNASYAHGMLIEVPSGAYMTNVNEYNKADYSSVRCLQDGALGSKFDAWGKANLNYSVSGSGCYGNNTANCTSYGRIYTWAAAMALPSICNTTVSTVPGGNSSSSIGGSAPSSSSGNTATGSCRVSLLSLGSCIEMSRSDCENIWIPSYTDIGGSGTYSTSECSTTEYPCCEFDGTTKKNFGSSFSKAQCISEGGTMANSAYCATLSL